MADEKVSENVKPGQVPSQAFPSSAVWPGESKASFDKLESALFAEHHPIGILEEECVVAIALAFWRKRHLSTFRRAEIAFQKYGHYATSEEAARDLHHKRTQAALASFKQLQQDIAKEKCRKVENVKEDSASEDSASEAIAAAKPTLEELEEAVRTATRDLLGEETLKSIEARAEVISREENIDLALAKHGKILTSERYLAELKVGGEIDAVIDAQLGRLARLQADRKARVDALDAVRSLKRSAIFLRSKIAAYPRQPTSVESE